MVKKILIVDDEIEMLNGLKKLFARISEFQVTVESDPAEALELLKENEYDLLLTDMNLGDVSGIDLCKKAKKNNPQLKVIVITGYGSIESSVEAMKAGASDFIEKPFAQRTLLKSINNSLQTNQTKGSKINTKEVKNFEGLIYQSQEMDEIVQQIKNISDLDVNILIHGESGTGKEIVARSLHRLSKRKDNPFVPVNSGALPENLFEGELFGHEKGSFTGATSTKPGLLEFANKGSFFFDEITELPLPIQSKLLRLLEDKKVRRIGGQKEIKLDVRIIAATNKSASSLLDGKSFRNDLYYRLSSFVIEIPPLRERRDDILPIFYNYLSSICKHSSKGKKRITKEAEELLINYDWPGNVREIINVVNKMFYFCPSDLIDAKDIPLPILHQESSMFSSIRDLPFKQAKDRVIEKFEIEYLKYNLSKYSGNISQTADKCGIDRRSVHRLIQKYGIIFRD